MFGFISRKRHERIVNELDKLYKRELDSIQKFYEGCLKNTMKEYKKLHEEMTLIKNRLEGE